MLNGSLFNSENSIVFWHKNLQDCGDILFDSSIEFKDDPKKFKRFSFDQGNIRDFTKIKSFERNNEYTFMYKDLFDNEKFTFTNPYIIKYLLQIPDFFIQTYDFNFEEDKEILILNHAPLNRTFLYGSFYYDYFNLTYYFFFKNSQYEKPFILPHYKTPSKYESGYNMQVVSASEFEKISKYNNKLIDWLAVTYNIQNTFYLYPRVCNEGESMEYVIPNYSFDSSTITTFLNTYVTIMLENVQKFKIDEHKIKIDLIKNPFVGVKAGYSFRLESLGYFDLEINGRFLIIKNLDGKQYFKIYSKFYSEFFDGICLYKFKFKEGDYRVFQVESISKFCN